MVWGGGVRAAGRSLGPAASVALLFAAAWGVALVAAGFLAPAYESVAASSSGEVVRSTHTLVDVNGLGVVVVLAVPFVVAVLVGAVLALRPRRGALTAAWALTGLLVVLNLLAMMSVGLFVVPATAALVVACSTCRARPRAQVPPTRSAAGT